MRINLGTEDYLIHKEHVREMDNVNQKPYSGFSKIELDETGTEVKICLNTQERIPFLIKDEPQQLSLVLYGAKSSDVLVYEGQAPSVQKIKVEPIPEEGDDAVIITIEFYQTIFGFDYWWDESELVIRVRKPPKISEYNPLE